MLFSLEKWAIGVMTRSKNHLQALDQSYHTPAPIQGALFQLWSQNGREKKNISKIGRKLKQKRQMIYYSFQREYLRRSAGPQVLFWQNIVGDKRVGAERYTGMRMAWRVGKEDVAGGGWGAAATEIYVESNFAKGISVGFPKYCDPQARRFVLVSLYWLLSEKWNSKTLTLVLKWLLQ